jgi:hypothetical protein
MSTTTSQEMSEYEIPLSRDQTTPFIVFIRCLVNPVIRQANAVVSLSGAHNAPFPMCLSYYAELASSVIDYMINFMSTRPKLAEMTPRDPIMKKTIIQQLTQLRTQYARWRPHKADVSALCEGQILAGDAYAMAKGNVSVLQISPRAAAVTAWRNDVTPSRRDGMTSMASDVNGLAPKDCYYYDVNCFYFLTMMLRGFECDGKISSFHNVDSAAVAADLGKCIFTKLLAIGSAIVQMTKAREKQQGVVLSSGKWGFKKIRAAEGVFNGDHVRQCATAVWLAMEPLITYSANADNVQAKLPLDVLVSESVLAENGAPAFGFPSRCIRAHVENTKSAERLNKIEQSNQSLENFLNPPTTTTTTTTVVTVEGEPLAKIQKPQPLGEIVDNTNTDTNTNLPSLVKPCNPSQLTMLLNHMFAKSQGGVISGEQQAQITVSLESLSTTVTQVAFMALPLIGDHIVLSVPLDRESMFLLLTYFDSMSVFAKEILRRVLQNPRAPTQLHNIDTELVKNTTINNAKYNEMVRDPTSCTSMLLLFAALYHHIECDTEKCRVVCSLLSAPSEYRKEIFKSIAGPMTQSPKPAAAAAAATTTTTVMVMESGSVSTNNTTPFVNEPMMMMMMPTLSQSQSWAPVPEDSSMSQVDKSFEDLSTTFINPMYPSMEHFNNNMGSVTQTNDLFAVEPYQQPPGLPAVDDSNSFTQQGF